MGDEKQWDGPERREFPRCPSHESMQELRTDFYKHRDRQQIINATCDKTDELTQKDIDNMKQDIGNLKKHPKECDVAKQMPGLKSSVNKTLGGIGIIGILIGICYLIISSYMGSMNAKANDALNKSSLSLDKSNEAIHAVNNIQVSVNHITTSVEDLKDLHKEDMKKREEESKQMYGIMQEILKKLP